MSIINEMEGHMDEIVKDDSLENAQPNAAVSDSERLLSEPAPALSIETAPTEIVVEDGAASSEEIKQQDMDRATVEAAMMELAQREEQILEAMIVQESVEIVPSDQTEEINISPQESEKSPAEEPVALENGNLKAVVEALLFVQGDPVSIDKIQEIVSHAKTGNEDKKIDKKILREILEALQQEYNQRNSAIQIVEVAGGWQFCTREEFSLWLEKLAKHKEVYKLSNSALETLSIIAYKQPITRAEVEHVRGVDSGGVVHNLLEKRLIRIAGRKECIGHPLLYGTTNEFLQYFGLAAIADLPMLEDLNKG